MIYEDVSELLSCYPCTSCEFSVAQKLLASTQVEGHSVLRERCDEKNVWDSGAERGTDMRMIATFSGLYAPAALTARVSVFSHDFRELGR
jgi:hypothetical protein